MYSRFDASDGRDGTAKGMEPRCELLLEGILVDAIKAVGKKWKYFAADDLK